MSPEDLPGPHVSAEAKARPRLLVVDDAPDSRLLLSRGFERRGFEVVEATDGEGALALIEGESFDLVLLDVVMPGVSGMEVLQSVRERHSAVALPIIMVTGKAESEGLAEALKLGANDYLTKPIDMVIAEARVAAHVGRKRADDEARRAFQGMQQAVREAQAANAIKSEFLANMSHEVRTPLNGVLGIADALGRTALNVEQRDLLATIRRSAVTLERLLCDVLDIAGADAGTLVITSEPVDLASAVRAAAGPWEMQAREKGLNFRLSVEAGAEGVVETDPVRLGKVLGNLLSNAVKFTPAGEVSLVVSRNGGEVLFTVRDTGVGFDDAAKARVFGRFEQGDGSTTRRYGGTGLGLAISRDLAERMGGSLDCASEPQAGSVFVLKLPLACVGPAEMGPTAAGAEVDPPGLPRVLVAEDHPVNRKVIELLLNAEDYELTFAHDGAAAVRAFEARVYDVILMDMQMPVMDGVTATRRIRELEAQSGRARTPILMVTANCMPEHAKACAEAGADAQVSKPLNPAELLGAIDAALTRNAAPGPLRSAAA